MPIDDEKEERIAQKRILLKRKGFISQYIKEIEKEIKNIDDADRRKHWKEVIKKL